MNDMSAVKSAPQSSPPKVDSTNDSSDDKSFQDSLDAKIHVDRENKKAADDQQKSTIVPVGNALTTTVPVANAQQEIVLTAEVAKMQADASQGNTMQQVLEELTQAMQQTSNQVEKPVADLIQQIQDAAAQGAQQPSTNQVKIEVQVNSQVSLQALAQLEAGSKAATDLVLGQNDLKATSVSAEKLVLPATEKTAPTVDNTAEKAVAAAQIQQTRPNFLTQLDALKNQTVDAKSSEILNQITDRIKTTMEAGKDVVKIQLQPENMGKVDVRIVRGSDGVQFFFTADTPSTSRMLQATMNQLHQNLLDAGVKVGNMSVSYQGQPGQQNNQGQQQRKNGFSFFGQDDSEFSADYSTQGAITALDTKA
jgi:flagellar hook-length control protein FliK